MYEAEKKKHPWDGKGMSSVDGRGRRGELTSTEGGASFSSSSLG